MASGKAAPHCHLVLPGKAACAPLVAGMGLRLVGWVCWAVHRGTRLGELCEDIVQPAILQEAGAGVGAPV